MANHANTHQSVERALIILKAFTPNNREMGTVEVSKMLKLNRSTVNRLMKVLAYHGFLRQDERTKKYCLGGSAAAIGGAITRSLDSNLISIAKPFIDTLCESVGENVGIEILQGNSLLYAYRARGPRLAHVSFEIGDRFPFHVAAGGKAILAFSPPEMVESLLPDKFRPLTPHTIIDKKVLAAELIKIREERVAYDRGEADVDVYVVAAPVFNHMRKPVAAVIIPVPVSRKDFIERAEVVSKLKDTADKISARLFYPQENNVNT